MVSDVNTLRGWTKCDALVDTMELENSSNSLLDHKYWWVSISIYFKLGNVTAYSVVDIRNHRQGEKSKLYLVLCGSGHHFDVALQWKFTNHDDFTLTVWSRSFTFQNNDQASVFVLHLLIHTGILNFLFLDGLKLR